MVLRMMFVAALALLLGGCNGWWSENRLIPVAARDTAGLNGVYASDEERVILAPGPQGLVRAVDPAGEAPPSETALALLREEAPEPSLSEEAAPEAGAPPQVDRPDKSYLMEIAVEGDQGKSAYIYAIARIAFAEDGTADRITMFTLLCSGASERFAARKEQKACIFDDYERLRAAALDALAWHDDARMEIETTIWDRKGGAEP